MSVSPVKTQSVGPPRINLCNIDGLGGECGHGIADVSMEDDVCLQLPAWAVRSGPRKQIYFDPKTVSAAVVTCGGLCPGLNDVIQAIASTLFDYGVPEDNVLGEDPMSGFEIADCVCQGFVLACVDSTRAIVVQLHSSGNW